MINLPTKESIDAVLEESVFDIYAEQAVNEAKQYDKAHGKKLSHTILTSFFKNQAPKLDSLQAVKSALISLYKLNGVELEDNGVNQIISTYKKRMGNVKESVELDEVSLTSDEKKAKDKLVVALKKNAREYRIRYKDKATADMQNLATALVKK